MCCFLSSRNSLLCKRTKNVEFTDGNQPKTAPHSPKHSNHLHLALNTSQTPPPSPKHFQTPPLDRQSEIFKTRYFSTLLDFSRQIIRIFKTRHFSTLLDISRHYSTFLDISRHYSTRRKRTRNVEVVTGGDLYMRVILRIR